MSPFACGRNRKIKLKPRNTTESHLDRLPEHRHQAVTHEKLATGFKYTSSQALSRTPVCRTHNDLAGEQTDERQRPSTTPCFVFPIWPHDRGNETTCLPHTCHQELNAGTIEVAQPTAPGAKQTPSQQLTVTRSRGSAGFQPLSHTEHLVPALRQERPRDARAWCLCLWRLWSHPKPSQGA